MRADPNLYTGINASIQQSEQQLQTAMNQLSSGKRVTLPSDDALSFAQNIQSLAASAQVDSYQKNADAVLSQAQMSDSALSSVVTSLTQAISLGTEGGNSTTTSAQRLGLAQQVQGLLSDVVSQANLTNNGVALFGGTSGTATPFVPNASADGYSYQGTSDSNMAQVGNNMQVTVNLPGDSIFADPSASVLGSLQQMITALNGGTTSDIANANAALTAAIAHLSQVRSVYGGTVDQLNEQNSYLSQETISLTSQQTSLVGIDTATAATNLTQAQTENSAVLAAAAKILPQSLLQYLQG